MKRVLFVMQVNPFVSGGGSQATMAYFDAVIDIFGEENVDVLTGEEFNIPVKYQKIHYQKIKIRKRLESVFQIFSGSLSRFTFPLIRHVKNTHEQYSLCVISGGVVAGKAVKILKKYNLKIAVIHHNYEVEYHLDNKSIFTLGGKLSYFVKKAEKAAYLNADINLFLTNQDIETFHSIYGDSRGSSELIGTFEMKSSDSVNLSNQPKEFTMAISGTLANYQTTIGVEDFYSHYFHIAKRLVPNLKIIVTGRSPSKRILEIQSEDPSIITIIPSPIDILSIVQKGSIYLCPTNIGGGLKLRAMDGLKCNLPVLVHEVSARGYDYFYDKPYFKIYRDEESFEQGLSDLIHYLKNDEKNNNIIQKDYYDYFSFSSGKKRFMDALLDSRHQIQ